MAFYKVPIGFGLALSANTAPCWCTPCIFVFILAYTQKLW